MEIIRHCKLLCESHGHVDIDQLSPSRQTIQKKTETKNFQFVFCRHHIFHIPNFLSISSCSDSEMAKCHNSTSTSGHCFHRNCVVPQCYCIIIINNNSGRNEIRSIVASYKVCHVWVYMHERKMYSTESVLW